MKINKNLRGMSKTIEQYFCDCSNCGCSSCSCSCNSTAAIAGTKSSKATNPSKNNADYVGAMSAGR